MLNGVSTTVKISSQPQAKPPHFVTPIIFGFWEPLGWCINCTSHWVRLWHVAANNSHFHMLGTSLLRASTYVVHRPNTTGSRSTDAGQMVQLHSSCNRLQKWQLRWKVTRIANTINSQYNVFHVHYVRCMDDMTY